MIIGIMTSLVTSTVATDYGVANEVSDLELSAMFNYAKHMPNSEKTMEISNHTEILDGELVDIRVETYEVHAPQKRSEMSLFSSPGVRIEQTSKAVISRATITEQSGTSQVNGSDETDNVYGYVKVFYDKLSYSSGREDFLITKVSGGYSLSGDDGVSVKSQTVQYASPTQMEPNRGATKYPGTRTSWSYNTGYSGYSNPLVIVGAKATFFCGRPQTSASNYWNFEVSNTIQHAASA